MGKNLQKDSFLTCPDRRGCVIFSQWPPRLPPWPASWWQHLSPSQKVQSRTRRSAVRFSIPDTHTGNYIRDVLEQSCCRLEGFLTLKRRGNTLAGWPLMTKRRELSFRRLASRSSRHCSRNLRKKKKRGGEWREKSRTPKNHKIRQK